MIPYAKCFPLPDGYPISDGAPDTDQHECHSCYLWGQDVARAKRNRVYAILLGGNKEIMNKNEGKFIRVSVRITEFAPPPLTVGENLFGIEFQVVEPYMSSVSNGREDEKGAPTMAHLMAKQIAKNVEGVLLGAMTGSGFTDDSDDAHG